MEDLTMLYCAVDDFWKFFRQEWEKHLIDSGKSKRGPEPELSVAEMMTIGLCCAIRSKQHSCLVAA